MRIKRIAHKKKRDLNAPPIRENIFDMDMEDPPLTQPPQPPPQTQPPPLSQPQPEPSPSVHASPSYTHSHSAPPPPHARTSAPSHHTAEDALVHDASRTEENYDKLLFSLFENSEKFKKVFFKRPYTKPILVDLESFKKKGYDFELLVSDQG